MIQRMKIVKANQYHLLANYDRTHENCHSNQYHRLANHVTMHENSESKPILSLSKP